ncbi:MAG: hypothetical protein R6W89_00625 [Candidatus Hydrogenedentota bacterium]
MNMAWVLGVILGATAAVDVQLAPDQPLPFVFSDEPLVIELVSDETVEAELHVAIHSDTYPTSRNDLGAVELRSARPKWVTVKDFPAPRGRFEAEIALVDGEEELASASREFFRVDRPLAPTAASLGIGLSTATRQQFMAARSIPVHSLRLSMTASQLDERLEYARKAGVPATLAVTTDGVSPEDIEGLAANHAESIRRWDIPADTDLDRFSELVDAIRRGGGRTPIAAVVSETAEVGPVLRNGAGRHISGLVIERSAPHRNDLRAFRSAAEEAGFEQMQLNAVDSVLLGDGGNEDERPSGPELVRQLLLNISVGVELTHLNAPALYEEGQFIDAYAYLSALVHRLEGAAYIGEWGTNHPVYALVFRRGNGWLLTIWSAEGEQEAELELGDVSGLAYYDGHNNPLPAPAVEEGVVTLTARPEPHYITGEEGNVFGPAAANVVREEAQAFLDSEEVVERLSEEFVELVETFLEYNGGHPERLQFFSLLRAFPYLEEQWQSGNLERRIAAPAIAGLHRLARALCVLEEEAGEPFIEPLQELLDRTSEHQSRYLTSADSGADMHIRGNWLLHEVTRLTNEARDLAAKDRDIEAAAVAALAEWRARSLQYTVRREVPEEEENNEE